VTDNKAEPQLEGRTKTAEKMTERRSEQGKQLFGFHRQKLIKMTKIELN
jgi:hypothetical protein